MKLAEFKNTEQIIAEDENFRVVAIDEAFGATRFAVRPSRGGMLSSALRKGAAAVKANPGLAALGAGLAVAGIAAYNKNKRNTMRLYARDYKERQMYKKIVDDLMKTGGYKKVKEKYAGGGYMWELKKR